MPKVSTRVQADLKEVLTSLLVVRMDLRGTPRERQVEEAIALLRGVLHGCDWPDCTEGQACPCYDQCFPHGKSIPVGDVSDSSFGEFMDAEAQIRGKK